nr:hypothetical protein CFP56_44365 [Quercus suber]
MTEPGGRVVVSDLVRRVFQWLDGRCKQQKLSSSWEDSGAAGSAYLTNSFIRQIFNIMTIERDTSTAFRTFIFQRDKSESNTRKTFPCAQCL